MRYRVRDRDGQELAYQSFGQVEQAWLLGLIEPDDEVLEEGKTTWRRAGSIPLLVRARRSDEQVWRGTWFLFTLIAVVGATVALVLLGEEDTGSRIGGALVAVATAVMVIQVSLKATRRKKPHSSVR